MRTSPACRARHRPAATRRAMGEGGASPAAVKLGGSVAGVVLGGAGTVAIGDDAVHVHSESGDAVIELSALEGLRYHDSRLTFFLRGGDRVEAEGTARLAAVAREASALVCTLPELTRPLRSLGSRRGRLGVDHDRFFAPLLAARRRGEDR